MSNIRVETEDIFKFMAKFPELTVREFIVSSIFQQCTIPTVRYNLTKIYGSPTVCKEALKLMERHGVITIARDIPDLTEQLKQIRFTAEMRELVFKNEASFDDFVKRYRSLFPPRYKGDPKGCKIKLLNFLKTYTEFTKDTVIKATKAYIEDFGDDYAYLQQAHYFILKNDVSNLASWCENAVTGNLQERNSSSLDSLRDS